MISLRCLKCCNTGVYPPPHTQSVCIYARKIYIYPTYTPSRDKSGNLYIKYFHEAFANNQRWKLKNRCWEIGIASLFFNLDCDVFIIQWVDLLPRKKFGKVQTLFFILAMLLAYVMRKKVVWVLHNKQSHSGKSKWVDICMNVMAKVSTSVVVHANDGVDFFNSKYPKQKGKCHYIPHPVYTSKIYSSHDLKWDYIVWGSISPRKGVTEFLEYASHSEYLKGKKILIAGRCNDKCYAQRITNLLTPNVCFINQFLSDEELADLIACSKYILFTYKNESLISSGALIYSLNFCKPIIAPNDGNFADMPGVVSCYNTFKDIESISEQHHFDIKKLEGILNEEVWEKFPDKIEQYLQT